MEKKIPKTIEFLIKRNIEVIDITFILEDDFYKTNITILDNNTNEQRTYFVGSFEIFKLYSEIDEEILEFFRDM